MMDVPSQTQTEDESPVAERGEAVDVYLLRVGEGRPIFYSEPPAPRADEVEAAGLGRGVRGWLERAYRRSQGALGRMDNQVARQTRRLWGWLRRLAAPDEPMLRRLRTAERIVLHHPESMTPDEARAAWGHYLAARRRHHAAWLALDLPASPLTVLLTPIPGPNVIGYWVAFRALAHTLALLGIGRARGRRATTTTRPTAALDAPPGGDGGTVGQRLGLAGLDDYLAGLGAGPRDEGDRGRGCAS
jgi:hypothetical protein